MLKKTLTLAAIAALACNCALAEDSTQTQQSTLKTSTGSIVFDGYVTLPGVTVKVITDDKIIDTGLNGKTIDMGVPDVSMATLKSTGHGNPRGFRVELDGYAVQTAGVMTATINLNGTPVDSQANTSIYKNELSQSDGGAMGAGVRLRYKGTTSNGTGQLFENGTDISETFTSDYSSGVENQNNYAFYFDAAIVAIATNDLAAGHVKSTVDITVKHK